VETRLPWTPLKRSAALQAVICLPKQCKHLCLLKDEFSGPTGTNDGVLLESQFHDMLHSHLKQGIRSSFFLRKVSERVKATLSNEMRYAQVYGVDVDLCDLVVGNLAEKKIPGFEISETAFLVFFLMSSRRLQADRFFTEHYNEKVYGKAGFECLHDTFLTWRGSSPRKSHASSHTPLLLAPLCEHSHEYRAHVWTCVHVSTLPTVVVDTVSLWRTSLAAYHAINHKMNSCAAACRLHFFSSHLRKCVSPEWLGGVFSLHKLV
jgi:hypothetical protein